MRHYFVRLCIDLGVGQCKNTINVVVIAKKLWTIWKQLHCDCRLFYRPHPKDGEGNIFTLCVSPHLDGGGGGGYPILLTGGGGGGTSIPGQDRGRGTSISGPGWGGGTPSQVQDGGGNPISGPDGGYPHLRSRMGVLHLRTGGTPSQDRGYPIPGQDRGYPHWDWMGYPPLWDWIGVPPPIRIGWGTHHLD